MTSRSGQSDVPQAAPTRLSAIGTTIDCGVIVFFWVAGAVILGLFVLLTRGKVTIIEEKRVRLRESLWLVGLMRE
jgi:hypothetical protein